MKSIPFLLLVGHINEFGKRRANPNAQPKNALKLTDSCACTEDPVCRDAILIENANARGIESVNFDGKTYSVHVPVLNVEGEELHPVP